MLSHQISVKSNRLNNQLIAGSNYLGESEANPTLSGRAPNKLDVQYSESLFTYFSYTLLV